MDDIVEKLRDASLAFREDWQLLRDAASEIARIREERRWIPVEERLPELDSEVLVAWSYEEDKEQVVSQAWRNHLGKFVSLEDIEFLGVTHWQPLPAPPKDGEVA